MEHNFLTEQTRKFLKTAVNDFSVKDQFYTDEEFFKKSQDEKLKEASTIYFSFPQNLPDKKLKKQHTEIYNYWNFINKKINDSEFIKNYDLAGESINPKEKKVNWVNLIYPETIDVNYSDYGNEKFFKSNLFVKEYKDGLMAVSQEAKSKDLVKIILGPSQNESFEDVIFSIGESLIFNESFFNFGDIDWNNKKFDNLILYFVAPKINKNKAVKIILKDNKYWNQLIQKYRENKLQKISSSELLFFREKSSCADVLRYLRNTKITNYYEKYYQGDSYKNLILKTGFGKTLSSNQVTLRNFKNKDYNEQVLNNKLSFEELKKVYLEEIFPHEQDLGPHYILQKDNDNLNNIYMKKIMIKNIVLNNFCSFDTLPSGVKINLENKSVEDCVLFWIKIDLFELFFNLFNKNNSRLSFTLDGILNNKSIKDSLFINHCLRTKSLYETVKNKCKEDNDFKTVKKFENIVNSKYEFKYKHILQEAMDSSTGYLMPYDGAFPLLYDPLFKFIRFREYEDLISIVISDKDERCLVEVFDKKEVDFKYMIWNDMKINLDRSDQCLEDIYMKLATCIRDAKILIERDSTMQFRGRRTPSGCNTDSTYEIYFPRTRYRRNPNKEQLRKERDFFNESRKFSGTRRQHIRRLVAGYKADKKQLLLAKQMDFYVPEGHTYVKASTWGDNMTKKEVRYRNKALNDILYYDKKEMSEAQKINQLSSAGFEEYCEKYIQKSGYEVKHKSNYDGGIDIRAVKILDNMEPENLLVQCKHWNSPIPPGEMRDFKTACDIEESKNKKFMFITSSRFSPGAIELADKFNIILIDGNDLITKK